MEDGYISGNLLYMLKIDSWKRRKVSYEKPITSIGLKPYLGKFSGSRGWKKVREIKIF